MGKKKARMERFGAAAFAPLPRVNKPKKEKKSSGTGAVSAEHAAKLEERKKRFGDSLAMPDRPLSEFEKKKKARMEKYGTSA